MQGITSRRLPAFFPLAPAQAKVTQRQVKGARWNLDWAKVSGAHYQQGKSLGLRQEAVLKEPEDPQSWNCETLLDTARLQLRPCANYKVHRAARRQTSS